MDKDRPVFLSPVYLPDYCFLSEAIEWIAFGRVPEASYTFENGDGEATERRFDWREMPDNFQPESYFPWYSDSEFASLGLVCPEGYIRAAELCFKESAFNLKDMLAGYESMEPSLVLSDSGEAFDLRDKLIRKVQEKLRSLQDEMNFVRAAERPFERFLELAWAKVFQLIQCDELKLEAIDGARWENFADDGEYEKAARFQLVDADDVPLGLDWSKNEIPTSQGKYVAARLSVDDVIRHLGASGASWETESVLRFGDFYRTMSGSQPPRRRGRPPRLSWNELEEHLRSLATQDRLPENKESCIFELISFAESVLSKSVGRTAVQRNLGTLLSELLMPHLRH